MARQEILENVSLIMKDVFELENEIITENMCSDDIEAWDSLTHLQLIGEIEEQFVIKFSMQEIMEMEDVGDMINIIERKMV